MLIKPALLNKQWERHLAAIKEHFKANRNAAIGRNMHL
jgi:hypothetical protein